MPKTLRLTFLICFSTLNFHRKNFVRCSQSWFWTGLTSMMGTLLMALWTNSRFRKRINQARLFSVERSNLFSTRLIIEWSIWYHDTFTNVFSRSIIITRRTEVCMYMRTMHDFRGVQQWNRSVVVRKWLSVARWQSVQLRRVCLCEVRIYSEFCRNSIITLRDSTADNEAESFWCLKSSRIIIKILE